MGGVLHQQESQPGGVTDGVPLSATAPTSNWPGITPNGLDEATTTSVAGNIATNPGGIGIVQLQYATDLGFTNTDPSKGVASVKNASGDYTQPTPVDVASALAYAKQLPDGTHVLDFSGIGKNVYNPSTYSYLLTPTTGWPTDKGAVMSAFVNFVLTLGQEGAPKIGYASLGLSLEQYGINAVTADVPGRRGPDRGRGCGLCLRRPHAERGGRGTDHPDLWGDRRHGSSAPAQRRQRGNQARAPVPPPVPEHEGVRDQGRPVGPRVRGPIHRRWGGSDRVRGVNIHRSERVARGQGPAANDRCRSAPHCRRGRGADDRWVDEYGVGS